MKLFNILIFLNLILLSQGQRGGGGGGGSGGSVGGSSYSGGDDTYQSCDQVCASSPEESKSKCIQDCENEQIQSLLIFIYICLGLFVLLGLVICFIQIDIKMTWYHRYICKKQMLNRIYRLKQTTLNQLLPKLRNGSDLEFTQNSSVYHTIRFQITSQLEKDESEITFTMKGQDQIGNWESKGFIVQDNLKIYRLQMFKEYENRQQAGQTGNWKYLIYEGSCQIDSNIFEGYWWYLGFESSNIYSGQWKLYLGEQNF